MALLDDVKQALRISSAAYDTEINDLILMAKDDLVIGGLEVADESKKLVKQAIILYAKTHFGYDNPDSEKFQQSYESIKMKLFLNEQGQDDEI
jgi:hypothetical protein